MMGATCSSSEASTRTASKATTPSYHGEDDIDIDEDAGAMRRNDDFSRSTSNSVPTSAPTIRTPKDLTRVRADIANLLNDPNHDDGSIAPLLIRFSWHCCGTYDAKSGTGGSNGSTMRFKTEQADPENAGLAKAREKLEPLRSKYSWLSTADLYVLAGTVAIEATGGPHIPFATGRRDFTVEEAQRHNGTSSGCPFGDGNLNPHGSRLPAADLGADPDAGQDKTLSEAASIHAVRMTFRRMGFNDKETVALIILGHQYGRAHPEVSGFENAWYAFDPAHWNVYLSLYNMLHMFRETITSKGKRQYSANFMGGKWMMLIADMVLYWDPEFRRHVDYYNRNRAAFHTDAAAAWKKLIELGCEGLLVEEQ